jgi:hypothetical protein
MVFSMTSSFDGMKFSDTAQPLPAPLQICAHFEHLELCETRKETLLIMVTLARLDLTACAL